MYTYNEQEEAETERYLSHAQILAIYFSVAILVSLYFAFREVVPPSSPLSIHLSIPPSLTQPPRSSPRLLYAYLLWATCGFFGSHRFYTKRRFSGAVFLFSFGLCGIGWALDGVMTYYLVRARCEEMREEGVEMGQKYEKVSGDICD